MDRRREQHEMTAAQQRLRGGGDQRVPTSYVTDTSTRLAQEEGDHVGRHRLRPDQTTEIPVVAEADEKPSTRGLAVTAAISLPAGAALLATGIVRLLGEQ